MRFNPPTEFDSIIKLIDDLADTNDNKYTLAQKTRAVNLALDAAYTKILASADTKGFDDRNFTTLPQGTYDITAGQRNLTALIDQEGAELLKIHRVIAKDVNGNWYNLERADIREANTNDIAFGTGTGKISKYDWVGNSIVFDVTPDTTIVGGLKIFYMRNSDYFLETDTVKEPGLPVIFHPYLAYYAAWQYAMKKGLQRKKDFKNEIVRMEDEMVNFMDSQSVEKNSRLSPYRVNVE